MSKVCIVSAKKNTEELSFIKLKRDTKFGEELTCFKIGIRNLTNFDMSTRKSQSKIFTLMGSFWTKYILFELKKYRRVIFHETEEGYKIWRGMDLSFQNWYKEFHKFWPEHLKVSKSFTLIGSFWAKYISFELATKVQRSYLSWLWRDMQILKKNWLAVWKKTWEIWQILTRALESVRIGTLMGSFRPR